MLEFIIFWTVIGVVLSGLIYVSYQHYRICSIRRKVDQDWLNISKTINEMDNKLKDLHNKIIDSENRLEEIRRDQTSIRRETDEISITIHKTLENELKKNKNSIVNTTIKASDAINVFNTDQRMENKDVSVITKKKKK